MKPFCLQQSDKNDTYFVQVQARVQAKLLPTQIVVIVEPLYPVFTQLF